MKKALLPALIVLAALAAACHERRQDGPRPDYDGIRARSESAHGALDTEGKQQP